MVDLTGDALNALGLNSDISSQDDYAMPQQWAAAVHRALPTCDGIRFVSRPRNTQFCCAPFDRSGFEVLDALVPSDAAKAARCFKLSVAVV